jgi:hypothetical protein
MRFRFSPGMTVLEIRPAHGRRPAPKPPRARGTPFAAWECAKGLNWKLRFDDLIPRPPARVQGTPVRLVNLRCRDGVVRRALIEDKT